MGLSQALFSAISGLVNHQRAMDNIGNNLANVNTVAFKKGVFQFQTLLEQTIRGGTTADAQTGRGPINPISLGLGTQTGSINKVMTQGALEVTNNVRDMAIDGNGYFVLRQGNSSVYTRDGTFYLGSDGTLLGNSGLQVQGVMADNGTVPDSGDVSDIIIPIGQTGGARETTMISMTGNLNSDQEIATGLKITGALPANANVASYLGGTVQETFNTWDALAGQAMINGGTVQTSSNFAWNNGGTLEALDSAGGAGLATDMSDIYYFNGSSWVQPFSTIADNDEITIDFRKGGRAESATFVYNTEVAAPSNTLEHFLNFLAGDVDDTTDITDVNAVETETRRLQGGAMGTIKTAGRVGIDNGGTSNYDVPPETAGAFQRTYQNAADYNSDGVADGNSYNVSIVSNLGSENAIEDIELVFNNVRYTDIFNSDVDYGQVQGGSTTTNMIVYDSLGNPKSVTMQMSLVERDTNFSTWRWVADSTDDTDADFQFNNNVPVADITTSTNVGTGLIRFDSNGQFVLGNEYSESNGIAITLEDQGVNSPLQIRMQNSLSSNEDQDLDFSALTQVAAASDFNLEEQDGTAPGTLDQFTVTNDGVIQGIFSNGVVEALARLVLAKVPNENGMIHAGGNLYYEGPSSGAAQIDFAGVGGRGEIRSGQLESSNVDLSEEFTKLITTERGFQANARVISTSDEMLVELVNLKR
ncbi:MAG: flagellar hook-basal body complex protein [Planctomycetes bacterium]|nr:flagellar hook-basal body complex protein [Planctomycetota bacterium]